MNNYKKIILGETIGTFILVFFGIGSVAVAVLFQTLNLYQIATIWCCAVIGGIYASKSFSDAHLNPAVSVGFLVNKNITLKELFYYLIGEFLGAFLAGLAIFYIFSSPIEIFELNNEIIRGTVASKRSAMIFGEYYPNPGNASLKELSTGLAMLLEGGGTFLLMLSILLLSQSKKMNPKFIPSLIGVTVGVLIVLIAPYTQAGFNPARDLMPRLVSAMMGWGEVVFNLPQFGFLTVYCFAPIIGAALAGLIYRGLKK